MNDQLRQFQAPALQAVTAQRDIGLLGLLVILLAWPDVSYPHGLVVGLPYGVLRRITFEEVLEGPGKNNRLVLASLRPGKDDTFLLERRTLIVGFARPRCPCPSCSGSSKGRNSDSYPGVSSHSPQANSE